MATLLEKVEMLRTLLSSACRRETSREPRGWSEGNPLWGHSDLVALFTEEYCGGHILVGSLEETNFADLKFHYWNRLPDGSEADVSAELFEECKPEIASPHEISAKNLRRTPGVAVRYHIFLNHVLRHVAVAQGQHDRSAPSL